MTQVSRENYKAGKYAKLDRFASYAVQVELIGATQPLSVLEIGVGDSVVSEYFRRHSPIAYTTADFAADLSPDIVADVRKLPLEANSYDTVCAFEVLEHLPFSEFEGAVRELMRVATKYVLISLPHFNHPIKFSVKVPLVREIKFLLQIPHPKVHVFDGQHYWEIGKRGYPARRIRSVLSKYGVVEREFVPFENPAHRFFMIRKTDDKLDIE